MAAGADAPGGSGGGRPSWSGASLNWAGRACWQNAFQLPRQGKHCECLPANAHPYKIGALHMALV